MGQAKAAGADDFVVAAFVEFLWQRPKHTSEHLVFLSF